MQLLTGNNNMYSKNIFEQKKQQEKEKKEKVTNCFQR
jgi:hypothetical protein